jgi:ABC-type glycerol-3-phosphate transport system substrate-binding protein
VREVEALKAMSRISALLLCLLLAGCGGPSDGKVHVSYWEKWTGAEGAAMQKVVDQFNRLQDKIVVEYLGISDVDRKTLIATAGGDPPDVAGIWLQNVYTFADLNALLPLDDFIRGEGTTPEKWAERYYPVYGDMGVHRGVTWAAPSTPSMTALHWNKTLFRAAGLDPEHPPRTLAELDDMAEKLTKRDPQTGRITQVGFLPQEPGWFSWAFPQWFGGQLWDGKEITIGTAPGNLECYQWVRKYTEKYGLEQIKAFTSGFGNFASPQNPFFSGQIAMVFQGVWTNNYIRQFAPGMEYGCAPWPAVKPELADFAVAEADMLAIPRGARHPKEAWQFIKFVSSINPQARSRKELLGMELLCFLQEKNSPLRQWSPFFEQHHPHPYIELFRRLAESPHAVHTPKIGIWEEFTEEQNEVFETVRLLMQSPEAALAFCQARVSERWAEHRRSLARHGVYAKTPAPPSSFAGARPSSTINQTVP